MEKTGAYVYLGGGEACICDESNTKFTYFGQRVELPVELAEHCARQRAHLMPAEQFDTFGFSEGELAANPVENLIANAPAEFQEKVRAARIAFDEYRESLLEK